jgi:DNA-binding MarR family transcriptional regulator
MKKDADNRQDADLSLDFLFARVRHMHHHRAVVLFEQLGLLFGQPPVLFTLWEQDGQMQTELARHMHRTPATVTTTLVRMEQEGWVQRRRDEQDRRVTRVFVTEKGMDIRPEVEAMLHQLDLQTFAGFNETERTLMRRFLLQMERNLDE